MARFAGAVAGGALFGVLAGAVAFLREAKSDAAQQYPSRKNGEQSDG